MRRAAATILGFMLVLAVRDARAQGAPPKDPPGESPKATQPSLVVPEPLRRGSAVSVRGLTTDKTNQVSLSFDGIPLVKAPTSDADAYTFTVPASGEKLPALGWHHAIALVTDPNKKAVETLDLGAFDLKPDDRPFAVTDILPKVSYPKDGRYEIVIVGTGFTDNGNDHVILINGRKADVCWHAATQATCGAAASTAAGPGASDGAAPAPSPDAPMLSGTINSQRELVLSGLSKEVYGGRPTIQVALGSGTPSAPRTVSLSRLREALAPPLAAAITAALFILIVAAARRSGPRKTTEGFTIGPIASLLLDGETETFSLSRFQFFAWTAVAVFSYLFLAIAQTLVQGRLGLPEIPGTLPGIIFISAGTSIGAVGVSSVRGPKGTGPMRPSFADLVSSGGIVGVDRFQFLTWTIVGVLSFLLVVLQSDPATVSALPSLPEGFLYLSGISAFGYLGGKMARNPGPVIDSAVVESAVPPLTIVVAGRNLAPVTVRLEGIDIAPFLSGASEGRVMVGLSRQPDPTDVQTQPARYRISLKAVDPSWVPNLEPSPAQAAPGAAGSANATAANQPAAAVPERKVRLTMVNADGQFSETLLSMPVVDESLIRRPK